MNNKYKAKKIEYRGMIFDSKKEYTRYLVLEQMQREGEISHLSRQVKYLLIPSQRGSDGRVIEREVSYIADFVYLTSDNELVVEDVKGYKNPSSAAYAKYTIKRKLMLYMKGIRIKEV